MAEPNQFVLTSDNQFGLSADGSWLLFDTAGECGECCGPPPPVCNDGNPEILNGFFIPDWILQNPSPLPNVFAFTSVTAPPLVFDFNGGVVFRSGSDTRTRSATVKKIGVSMARQPLLEEFAEVMVAEPLLATSPSAFAPTRSTIVMQGPAFQLRIIADNRGGNSVAIINAGFPELSLQVASVNDVRGRWRYRVVYATVDDPNDSYSILKDGAVVAQRSVPNQPQPARLFCGREIYCLGQLFFNVPFGNFGWEAAGRIVITDGSAGMVT